MDRRQRKSVNYKECNLINTNTSAANINEAQNSYVIPTTTNTSMAPVILPPPKSLTKDAAGNNQYQMPHYRNTRQRTHNANLQQKIKPNTNTTVTEESTTQRQTTTIHKNYNTKTIMSNQVMMNAKAAACIASPIEQLAAVHAKATSSRNKNEEAINDLKMRIPEIENIFDIHSRIGNGTFSTVLLGTLKKQRSLPENLKRKYAIKHHIPTSHPDRIMKELQCMAKIGGTDNVVGINCCIRCNESVAFIMPYLAHDRFHDFYNKMEVAEVQFYMKNLLVALRHVHRFNVIHRDVKPSNFLYNRRKRQFLLVDFGLAQLVSSSTGMINNNTNSNPGLAATPKKTMNNVGEGKRLREQDDTTNTKKCLDGGAVAVTGLGEVVTGTAKRLRCVPPEQETTQSTINAPTATGGTIITSAANTGALTQTPFKMPLKQINEIDNNPTLVGSKGTVTSGSSNASVSERKSVGPTNAHGMNSRLQQKLRVQAGAAEGNQQSSARTSSAGVGKNNPHNTQTTNANSNNNNDNPDSKYNTNRSLSNASSPKCYCYGNPQVCNLCLVKKEIHASRAGTPGYRPPEVLLKYPDQTTAVDIWASGVIFLSVLSSVYPFFKAPNDYVALAEMITIFGDKTIRKTAYVLDRLVTLSQKTKPLDLRKLCVRFRNRAKFSSPELLKKHQRSDGTCEVCKNCDQFFFNCLCLESAFITEPLDQDDIYPPSAYDLLYRLLEINPHKRITAEEALRHPFFLECHDNNDNITTTSNSATNPVSTSAMPPNTPLVSLEAAGDSLRKLSN